jgi:hypothetical protein
MRRILTALAVLGMVAGASTAHATTIGTISIDGLVFTLSSETSLTDLSGDGNTDDYLVTLTLNTDDYAPPGDPTQYISWVSPNFAPHNDIDQTGAPDASWLFHDGAANNSSGCNDISASGKFCSQTADTNTVLDGTTWTWTWIVDTDGAFINPPHLQAAWFGPDGKTAISQDFEATSSTTSSTTTTTTDSTGTSTDTGAGTTGEVPEPTSLLLLGSGLAGAALKMRRKR